MKRPLGSMKPFTAAAQWFTAVVEHEHASGGRLARAAACAFALALGAIVTTSASSTPAALPEGSSPTAALTASSPPPAPPDIVVGCESTTDEEKMLAFVRLKAKQLGIADEEVNAALRTAEGRRGLFLISKIDEITNRLLLEGTPVGVPREILKLSLKTVAGLVRAQERLNLALAMVLAKKNGQVLAVPAAVFADAQEVTRIFRQETMKAEALIGNGVLRLEQLDSIRAKMTTREPLTNEELDILLQDILPAGNRIASTFQALRLGLGSPAFPPSSPIFDATFLDKVKQNVAMDTAPPVRPAPAPAATGSVTPDLRTSGPTTAPAAPAAGPAPPTSTTAQTASGSPAAQTPSSGTEVPGTLEEFLFQRQLEGLRARLEKILAPAAGQAPGSGPGGSPAPSSTSTGVFGRARTAERDPRALRAVLSANPQLFRELDEEDLKLLRMLPSDDLHMLQIVFVRQFGEALDFIQHEDRRRVIDALFECACPAMPTEVAGGPPAQPAAPPVQGPAPAPGPNLPITTVFSSQKPDVVTVPPDTAVVTGAPPRPIPPEVSRRGAQPAIEFADLLGQYENLVREKRLDNWSHGTLGNFGIMWSTTSLSDIVAESALGQLVGMKPSYYDYSHLTPEAAKSGLAQQEREYAAAQTRGDAAGMAKAQAQIAAYTKALTRPKGLCNDWQEAIRLALAPFSGQFWEVREIGRSDNSKHNAVLVCPKGWDKSNGDSSNCFVFDPWFYGTANIFPLAEWDPNWRKASINAPSTAPATVPTGAAPAQAGAVAIAPAPPAASPAGSTSAPERAASAVAPAHPGAVSSGSAPATGKPATSPTEIWNREGGLADKLEQLGRGESIEFTDDEKAEIRRTFGGADGVGRRMIRNPLLKGPIEKVLDEEPAPGASSPAPPPAAALRAAPTTPPVPAGSFDLPSGFVLDRAGSRTFLDGVGGTTGVVLDLVRQRLVIDCSRLPDVAGPAAADQRQVPLYTNPNVSAPSTRALVGLGVDRGIGGLRDVLAAWLHLPRAASTTAIHPASAWTTRTWERGMRNKEWGMWKRAEDGTSAGRQDRPTGEVLISVVATGRSSGEVFQLQIVNPSGRAAQFAIPEGLVLEPIKQGTIEAVGLRAQDTVQTQGVNGYCLDFAKPPPPAGVLYRVAGREVQREYRPLHYVLRAARQLDQSGRMHPDSNAATYADFIRQWSMWAKRENWDVARFGEHFAERTKKNVQDMKRSWTKEMEATLRGVVPGRWRDITAVLDEARALEEVGVWMRAARIAAPR